MASTSLVSVGRITTALPSGKVLYSENPSKPDESRVIITEKRQPDHLQSFYLCCKSSDKTTGVLATYDLKYILRVSTSTDASGNRIIHYIKSPEPLFANGASWPSWVTQEMMFHQEKDSSASDCFWLISQIQRDSKPLVMDVRSNSDTEGNILIAYPRKDGSPKNQLFKLENISGSGAKK